MIALKDEADVLLLQREPIFLPQRVDRLPLQLVLAAPVGVVHPENVQQRRLPRSRRPHDRDEFAGLDVEVDATQQERFAGAGLDRTFRDCGL